MTKRTNSPLVVAHRGASKAERENTLAAFRRARELGADMVELDVRVTADRQLVVHHDPVFVTDAGVATPICTVSNEGLPVHIPSLDDALTACVGMDVNIEIKNDPSEPDYDPEQFAAGAVLHLLARRGDASRMLISSFDAACVEAIRSHDASIRTGFLCVAPLPDPATCIAMTADAGHVAIHPHRRFVDATFVERAHERGLAVNVWTVDDPTEMQNLIALGVDAIITNLPDVARSLVPRL